MTANNISLSMTSFQVNTEYIVEIKAMICDGELPGNESASITFTRSCELYSVCVYCTLFLTLLSLDLTLLCIFMVQLDNLVRVYVYYSVTRRLVIEEVLFVML